MIRTVLLGVFALYCASDSARVALGQRPCRPIAHGGRRPAIVSLPVRSLPTTPIGAFSVAAGDSLAIVARDADAWAAAWSAAGAAGAAPPLDFTREFGVVVATATHGSSDARIVIDSVYRLSRSQEAVVVLYSWRHEPAVDTLSRAAAAVAVQCSPDVIGAIRFRSRGARD